MHFLRTSFARLSSPRALLLAVSALALTTAACGHTHVPIYQRTRLAHPSMVTAGMSGPMDGHVRAIQEGATGGDGGGSSGCGCN